MSQPEAGKRLPNAELGGAIEKAQQYAARLKDPMVHDFHVLRELLAVPSIQSGDHELFQVGASKNTVDLAVQGIFGKGDKKDERAAQFSPHLRDAYEAALTISAEEGRLAEPVDLLSTILEDPSIAIQMILSTIAENNIAISGRTPFIAKSRIEVWSTLLSGANGPRPNVRLASDYQRFSSIAPKRLTKLD